MDDVTIESVQTLQDHQVAALARPLLIRVLRVLWSHNNDDPAALRAMIMRETPHLVEEVKSRIASLKGGKTHAKPVDLGPEVAMAPIPAAPPATPPEEPPPPPAAEPPAKRGRGKAAAVAEHPQAGMAELSTILERLNTLEKDNASIFRILTETKEQVSVLSVQHAGGVKDLQTQHASHSKQIIASIAAAVQLLTGTPPEEFKSISAEMYAKLYPTHSTG